MDGLQRDESQSTANGGEISSTQSPGLNADSALRSMNANHGARPQVLKLAPLPGPGVSESKAGADEEKTDDPPSLPKSQMMLSLAPRVSPETTAGTATIKRDLPAIGKPGTSGPAAPKPELKNLVRMAALKQKTETFIRRMSAARNESILLGHDLLPQEAALTFKKTTHYINLGFVQVKVLDPTSTARQYWDLFLIPVILLSVNIQWFNCAWFESRTSYPPWMEPLTWTLWSFIVLDVGATFFTAFYDEEGALVFVPRRIFQHYLSFGFGLTRSTSLVSFFKIRTSDLSRRSGSCACFAS